MTDVSNIITRSRTRALQDYDENPSPANGRLQVRVGEEYQHLVNRLSILMGCKRAEVVQLALEEFAARIHPDLTAAR